MIVKIIEFKLSLLPSQNKTDDGNKITTLMIMFRRHTDRNFRQIHSLIQILNARKGLNTFDCYENFEISISIIRIEETFFYSNLLD